MGTRPCILPAPASHPCCNGRYDTCAVLRGFGTVRFASQADAEAAIERLANSMIEDRAISVRMDRFA